MHLFNNALADLLCGISDVKQIISPLHLTHEIYR